MIYLSHYQVQNSRFDKYYFNFSLSLFMSQNETKTFQLLLAREDWALQWRYVTKMDLSWREEYALESTLRQWMISSPRWELLKSFFRNIIKQKWYIENEEIYIRHYSISNQQAKQFLCNWPRKNSETVIWGSLISPNAPSGDTGWMLLSWNLSPGVIPMLALLCKIQNTT